MRIFIIHHHLHPGGVTSVIQSQVEALIHNGYTDIVLLTGDNTHAPAELMSKVGMEELPVINYLTDEKLDILSCYEEILSQLHQRFTKHDVLHFHNLNLGKNPLLSRAVYQLAGEGFKIFNHVHDFAEDRPVNMKFMRSMICDVFRMPLAEVLYPDFSNYHFGVLTTHDKERIINSNISPHKISLLPNPVKPPEPVSQSTKDQFRKEVFQNLNLPVQKKLAVYPVRGITRKNLGEYILLSVLFAEAYVFVVTQPPKNPKELPQYKSWKVFCEKENMPLIFEAGVKTNFPKLMHAADICFTTSVLEGFGMVYLEPWLFDTPVAGRNLPSVTDDFFATGIKLDALYNGLLVYVNGEKRDFADISTEDKEAVIKKALKDNNYLKSIIELNSIFFNNAHKLGKTVIDQNKKAIFDNYSLEKYGYKLHVAYSKLTQ